MKEIAEIDQTLQEFESSGKIFVAKQEINVKDEVVFFLKKQELTYVALQTEDKIVRLDCEALEQMLCNDIPLNRMMSCIITKITHPDAKIIECQVQLQ